MARNFSKKRTLRQMMQSNFFLVFLAVLIFVFAFNIFNFINKAAETRKNRQITEEKIKELENSRKDLNFEINKLKTENGIEEALREKFGVAKEGENMILVVEDKNQENIEKESKEGGFFSWFKDLFQ